MNVLILGSGGREHALASAVAKSPRVGKLFVAPGNPGCGEVATQVALDLRDHARVVSFCREERVDLVIVGPEAPLVAGIADDLAESGIACFGPSGEAARLEGSKGFTKDFCREFNVPTAAYRRFSDKGAALAYVRAKGAPLVVKADGLASGKGVVVAATTEEAEAAIEALFEGAFGAAGAECVVEERLEGEELSFFALCDGERAVGFGDAQDHKRIGEGDTGPNTGGMGAYSPTIPATPELAQSVMREIINPTLRGMASRGTPFCGVLFAGLMLGRDGPKLIEFNVRFGDPEAEVILARFRGDLLAWLWGAATGRLPTGVPEFAEQAALTVVIAARGYPAAPEKGAPISGLDEAAKVEGVIVLHAGTRRVGETIVVDGGRVLAVTAMGSDLAEARTRAYAAAERIGLSGGYYRRDIGFRALGQAKPG